MSRFEKRDHFTLIFDFELVILCESTVNELFVALCCVLIAPIPEICSLEPEFTLDAMWENSL